jgi:membrane protease YdiL (CAAX protease family)
MKALRSLFTNPFFLGGVAVWVMSFFILTRRPDFSFEDQLVALVLFAFVLPLIAWFALWRARPLEIDMHPRNSEMLGILAYVLALSAYLAFGPQTIDRLLPQIWTANAQIHFFINAARKLIVFVLLPYLLFGPPFGYRRRDFGLQAAGWRESVRTHLPVILVISGFMLVFQYFVGNAAAPIREGRLTSTQLAAGLPLAFIWLAIEAGFVEEFFFRGLLQARLSAWFRSEVTGVVLMSLAFGLAHAPGFIFRNAGEVEGLGANPSALDAIAYSIATIAIIGILFGVIWARTKNLIALILIHAAIDLLPNVSGFVKTWRL